MRRKLAAKRIIGRDVEGTAPETDFFGNCPVRGALLDMRGLAQMLAHIHQQEIEIIECDGKPAREGPVHKRSQYQRPPRVGL